MIRFTRAPIKPPVIMTWDTETRPLVFANDPFSQSAEITAMAWVFSNKPKDFSVYILGRDDPVDMIKAFAAAYQRADIVGGHYVRRFDLPIAQSSLIEYGLPLLGPKMVIDTKSDMVKKKDLSASQENLSEMLGLAESKFHMNATRWRAANRLTPEGLALTETRVISDVVQNVALRTAMLKNGLLKGPSVWRP